MRDEIEWSHVNQNSRVFFNQGKQLVGSFGDQCQKWKIGFG